jgi:DNA-binding IscR family transcriptional regulator
LINRDVQHAVAFLHYLHSWKPMGPSRRISLTEAHQAKAIPRMFLEQIAVKLRKAAIVQAFRGVGGGYRLLKEDVTYREVYSALGHEPPIPPELQHKDVAPLARAFNAALDQRVFP